MRAGAAPDAAERLSWLRLARADGVGPVTFFGLLSRFGSASAAVQAVQELTRRAGTRRPVGLPSIGDIEAEITRLDALGARLLTAGDPDFPAALAAVSPPPPVISVLGRSELLAKPSVVIVGRRNASAAGLKMARMLATDLGQAGYVIVSGLARGVDGAAHEASLPTGTIAVVAGGLDFVYPREHEALQRRIGQQGLLVSENPLGATVKQQDFPRRNRIVSGLSLGVVVVEAEERSGTLITARTALEQGREVFAVPGSPLDPRAKGTNRLIRQGATLTESAADVIEALQGITRPAMAQTEPSLPLFDHDAVDDTHLRDRLAGLLSPAPVSLDDLAQLAAAPVSAVAALVVDLELSGEASSLPGGMVVRAA